MKGNKMPIKIVPIKKKKSPPKPPASRRTPKGGGPLITPGQKKKLDQMTGKAKPLEANVGGMLKTAKKMMSNFKGNFKKNKKPTMAKNTKAKGKVQTAKNGGVIKAKGGLMAALSPAYAASKGGMGGLAENFSPAYSIMKGKGPASQIVSALGGSSLAGNFAQRQRDKAKKGRAAMEMERAEAMQADAMPRMKSGGSVKKKKSIDGMATKGRTRA